MTAENNKMKNKNQEIDEYQKLTLDIFEYYTKSDFEGIETIMEKITPKVKEEVIQYLNRFITYVNGWSDEDPSKKGKLLNFRIVKEIVQKYPLLQNWDKELKKEMDREMEVHEN